MNRKINKDVEKQKIDYKIIFFFNRINKTAEYKSARNCQKRILKNGEKLDKQK